MTKVFLQLANMSITASYLILAILLLRLLLRKVPKNLFLWLWALVGVRLALPISLESALSLIPKSQPIPADIALSPAPAIASGIPAVDQAVNPVIAENFTPTPVASANPLQVVLPILAGLWLVGVAVMGLYALLSYLRLGRKVSVSLRLRENIYLCDGLPTPFLLGLVKPKIYLPSEMEPEHQEYVLRHEQAHLRHHDNWWKPLGFLLLSVYWFNPLVWAAYILFCRDLEMACDERAVAGMAEEERKAYSYALLACAAPRRTISVCPVAFGENSIKSRIQNVLRFKKAGVWLAALVLLIAGVTAVCFLTNPKEEAEEPEAPTQVPTETIPEAPKTPTQIQAETIPSPSEAEASPYPELAGLTFENLDGNYTYEDGKLSLLFHNVSKVATQILQGENGEEYEQTILLKAPDTTMEIINANMGRSAELWVLSELTYHEEDIYITDQAGQIPLRSNEYWLRNLVRYSPGRHTPVLRLISRIEPSPGEQLDGSPSPFPPSLADLTFSPEDVVIKDLDDEYTYANGNLSLLFRKVSKVGTRILRDRNGEEYVQTILMKDFATTMELSSADLDGSQWAWRLSESTGTEQPITVTDQMYRHVLSNNEYYLQDLLSGRTVLVLKRAARLHEADGALRPETAQAALAIDLSTGETLYAYWQDQRVSTGALNHAALALAVLEDHAPEEMVDTTVFPVSLPGQTYQTLSSLCGKTLADMGEMPVRDLLNLMLMWHCQDAACVLAQFDAGSEAAMVEKMNALTDTVCQSTHFTDIYGVDDGQNTTAYDALLLTNRMLENPCLAQIWQTREYTLRFPDGEEVTVPTSNYMMDVRVIPEFYDARVTGGLATYQGTASLIITAQQDGRDVVCVLLGAERKFRENGWAVECYGNFEEMAALLNTVLDG